MSIADTHEPDPVPNSRPAPRFTGLEGGADCPSCSNLRSQNTALCDLLVQEADALHNVREYALECSDWAGGALDPATVSARLWAIVAGLPLPVRPCPVCVARRAQCQLVADTMLGLADLQRAPL